MAIPEGFIEFSSMRRQIHERLMRAAKIPAPPVGIEVRHETVGLLRKSILVDELEVPYDAFFLWAVRKVFEEDPRLNALAIEEGGKWYVKTFGREMNICIAVETSRALLTPPVPRVESHTFPELVRVLRDVISKIKGGVASPVMGTFTLNNAGAHKMPFGIPIISYPQVANLAVHFPTESSGFKYFWAILSFHHGYCDAGAAANFLRLFKMNVESLTRETLGVADS